MLHLHWKKGHRLRLGFVFFILLILTQGPKAQSGPELNLYDHDNKPYYFGITLGINLARFQTTLDPRFLQYDSVLIAEPVNSGGFTLGLSATARLSDRFQLRFNPQLMFIERNIYYKITPKK